MSSATTSATEPAPLRAPGGVTFRTAAPSLVLPRRTYPTTPRAVGMSHAPAEREFASSSDVKRQLAQVLALLRTAQERQRPRSLVENRNNEIAQSLQEMELKLAERERTIEERELSLAERERDVAESEVLLKYRETLLMASKTAPGPSRQLTEVERIALDKLKAELDRQEAALKEAREQLRERERFIEESERKLFDKVQEHQERETELEQMAEELRMRQDILNGTDSTNEPKKEFDEFNE